MSALDYRGPDAPDENVDDEPFREPDSDFDDQGPEWSPECPVCNEAGHGLCSGGES